MTQARTIIDFTAPLTLLALTGSLPSCSEPLPSELDARYVVGLASGSSTARVSADFTAESRSRMPDMSDGTVMRVNDQALNARGVVERPGRPADTFEFVGSVPVVGPGGAYTFILDLPWQKGTTVSIPTIAPADFVAPPPLANVPFHEDLAVQWSTTDEGAQDTLALTLLPTGPEIDHERVAAGETGVTLPAKILQKAFKSRGPGVQSVEVELTLRRTRFISSSPPFASGTSHIEEIVARMPLTLVP